MMLAEGDRVLIAHRRLFERDESRFFAGEVLAYEAGLVKVRGHTFVRDLVSGRILEKAEPRTKVFSVASGTLIVYQLPESVCLESFQIVAEEGQVHARDAQGFSMNLTDHAHGGTL